jgi:hypothetical protein
MTGKKTKNKGKMHSCRRIFQITKEIQGVIVDSDDLGTSNPQGRENNE